MAVLSGLHAQIEERVQHIRDGRPDWLCAKGCDRCCRQLADRPRLSALEWELLREGLSALPVAILNGIRERMALMTAQNSVPYTCPLLDAATGVCLVYGQRPVACRTYGFYAQRELGLYCPDIQAKVENGLWADVVWGNHDAIDRALAQQGETRTLDEWFCDYVSVGG